MIEERSSLVYVTGKGKIEQPKPVAERPKTDGEIKWSASLRAST